EKQNAAHKTDKIISNSHIELYETLRPTSIWSAKMPLAMGTSYKTFDEDNEDEAVDDAKNRPTKIFEELGYEKRTWKHVFRILVSEFYATVLFTFVGVLSVYTGGVAMNVAFAHGFTVLIMVGVFIDIR
ncbi:unnamed protein product, partial [Owenia fusiformis]